MAEFEIKLIELEAGSREYDFPIRAAWLCEALADLASDDFAMATVDGTLHVGRPPQWKLRPGKASLQVYYDHSRPLAEADRGPAVPSHCKAV